MTAYAYDTRGNLAAVTNANGTVALHGYDDASRLVTLTNMQPDASVISAYALALDGLGNHVQSAQEQPLYPILASQTNSYSYDLDNRLASIDGQPVTHDLNGNLKSIGTNVSYAYDFDDRLVAFSVTNVAGSCAYDGLGNRLMRTVSGQATRFVLDRAAGLTQVLMETGTNGSPIAFYIYGLGLAQRITPAWEVSTYHQDMRGSAVALTDASGNVTDAYAYDSFGVLANKDGDSAQPFRYLARHGIVDEGAGLLYARARHFSPELGRFLTKDPLTGSDSDSQSLNRYAYALNNPLRLVDISGLTARDFDWSSFQIANSTPAFVFVQNAQGLRIRANYANSTMAACTDCRGISIVDLLSLGLLVVDILDSPFSPGPDTSLIAVELETAQIEVRGGTYLLRDPLTEQVMRTGRSNDLLRRAAEHGRDPLLRDLQFEPVHRTDVYAEQRGLEQLLHETYNPPLNYRNPISPMNPNLDNYLDAAQSFLQRTGL